MLEKVQKRLVSSMQGLMGPSYEEKLLEIGIDSLEDRRPKLDLIENLQDHQDDRNLDEEDWD